VYFVARLFTALQDLVNDCHLLYVNQGMFVSFTVLVWKSWKCSEILQMSQKCQRFHQKSENCQEKMFSENCPKNLFKNCFKGFLVSLSTLWQLFYDVY